VPTLPAMAENFWQEQNNHAHWKKIKHTKQQQLQQQ